MPKLEHLLEQLQREPVDHPLDGVADDVRARLMATASATSQTWGLRAGAVMAVMLGGAVVSASAATASAPADASPFAAWSSLAPSTLLEPSE